MHPFTIVILIFVFLELSNVVALYFVPGTKMANSVGVFKAWESSKQYPEIHDFVKYLVYWVAGAKLIFLLLLIMIVFFGDLQIQRLSLIALGVATLSFFGKLYPLIRKMDKNGQVMPGYYSLLLAAMIGIFVLVFLGVAIFY